MAQADGDKNDWEDDDRVYSCDSHSDDSPILSYRYDKRRFVPYTSPVLPEDRERKSSLPTVGKLCLFCAAMIMFCVLMYIPVYNKASYYIPKGLVSGWSIHTNRDTKIYVQPNNVTTIHEPRNVCHGTTNNKLFLLIIVFSSTENFENRTAIRQSWGDYKNYKKTLEIFNTVKEKYKDYDYKKKLYPNSDEVVTHENVTFKAYSTQKHRFSRDISSFKELLPALANALNNLNLTKTEEVPEEKRFDDEDDEPVLPVFDMNKELEQPLDYDYDYPSNVMKIPPKGYEDDVPDLNKIVNLIKQNKNLEKLNEEVDTGNTDPEFKVVFILGLPSKNNGTIQKRIEEEVNMYGDIIQEGFIDSYNNLTLKSIMMLKWLTNRCNNSVRYILKTDDDMYISLPNLLTDLQNRSDEFDKKIKNGHKGKEYLLIGHLFSGARPILNARDKWYSPRYMYNERVYPRYLSGTGYAMSLPTAQALYAAALRTHLFHLEDIYITGMCPLRASPRVVPRNDPLFSPTKERSFDAALCSAHARINVHRVEPKDMRTVHQRLMNVTEVDRCERIRLTKVRQDRINRLKQLAKKRNHTSSGKTKT